MVTRASHVSEQRKTEYNSGQQNISFLKLQVKIYFCTHKSWKSSAIIIARIQPLGVTANVLGLMV